MVWQWGSAIAIAVFGFGSGLHALLNKRDPRATLNWIFICIVLPIFGPISYWVLGVNRIKTKAQGWQDAGRFSVGGSRDYTEVLEAPEKHNPERATELRPLTLLSDKVCRTPLVGGCAVEPLFNGEEAYPAMLEAIENAQDSVYLCTYIFDTDDAGQRFIRALGTAAARGVDVRVLLDAIGERYSRPRARKLLRRHSKIRVARFLPLAFSLRGLRINLRNHRKILVVDGKVAFTGGMNIGQRHMVEDENNRNKTADVHFRVSGPAASSLEDMFFEDWSFATGEKAPIESMPINTEKAGDAICRSIPDGPNEDFEVLQWMLVGALSCAKHHIKIMTPYFIPGPELVSAFNAAALRGVQVDLILPGKNNLPFVKWASHALLKRVTRFGTRVYYQPPPFNHSKLLIMDGHYVILGSANLDPRSLRLNFEFNLEVFDEKFASRMSSHFERIRERSALVDSTTSRNFFVQLRDSIAKLLAPYL